MAKDVEISRLAVLVNRAMDSTITPKEREELQVMLSDPRYKTHVEKMLEDAWARFAPSSPVFSRTEGDGILRQILEDVEEKKGTEVPMEAKRKTVMWRWLVAASVLLISAVAIYFFQHRSLPDPSVDMTLAEAVVHAGIEAGKERAVIVLADGRTIVLDSVGNGLIAEEAGVRISKLADGRISYENAHTNDSSFQVAYNTIEIPKGGHFKLLLPDGTKVHLNSESTLKYPVRFDNDIRLVELTGEALFEVVSTTNKLPFMVKTPTQQVEVLGTVFNVNAYNHDKVRTALGEGRVKVGTEKGDAIILKPGEVAVSKNTGYGWDVRTANMDEELAWHNGYFIFNNEHIQTIMDRVARWYDIEIVYDRGVTDADLRFGGIFQRSKSISQLLENLKETGLVDFEISGRRVVVTKM